MDIIPQKHCTKCNQDKPRNKFAKNKRSRDGLQSTCDACRHAHYRELRNDPVWVEMTRQRARERYHNDPEYRASMRASSNRYDQNQWRNNPEYRRRKIDWKTNALRTKDHWKAKEKTWRRVANHIRRSRKTGVGGSFTAEQWRRLCEYYDHRCVCCDNRFQRLTVDHVIPLSKGGTNYIQNIQPLCRSCNSRKHDKEIDYRPSLPDWFGEGI